MRACTLLVGLSLIYSANAAKAEPAKDVETRKVLILSSYEPVSPGSTIVSEKFSAALREGSTVPVRLYHEFLDSSRVLESKYEAIMVGLLRQKYEAEKPDLICVLGVPALELLLRNDLFLDTPKIFCFFEETEAFAQRLGPGVAGIRAKLEYGKTLDIALALHPETRNVFVVAGHSGQDRFLLSEADKEFRKYQGRAEFTYLSDLAVEELRQRLATLPNGSIVIFLSFFLDSAGRSYSGPQGASMVSSVSSAPVYGIAKTYLGSGIVGGSLLDFEAVGSHLGNIGLRVLDRQRPEEIAPQTEPNVAMFDSRELRRWGISESKLPAGSIVEFNEPSFWERYKWHIAVIICVGAIEVLLITGLLINRTRRRQAEKESSRLAQVAEAERRKRDEVISNMPGVVWERGSDPANDTQKSVVIGQHIEKLLGYSAEEWLSNPDFMQSIIHDEDREEFTRICDEILTGRPEANLQFRWRTKDGRVLWAEAHLYPILDEGAVTGLRGVTLDITNRKRAEEELRQIEERLRLAQCAARVGTWEWNLTTGESTWSEGIYKLLGLEPGDGNASVEDFIGFIHPQDRDRALRKVESVISDSGMYYDEFRIIRRDGSIVWLASKGNAVRGDSGRAERMIGVNIDITERKLAQEAMRQIEQRHQDIIRTLPDLMFVQTAEGIYLDYTASESSELLVPPEEFLGKNMRDVLPEELADRFFNCFQRAKETGEVQILEYTVPARGEPNWYEARIIHTNSGHFLSIVRNISKRKQAEAQLIESEERFRNMAETAPVMIWVSDINNLRTYVNQRWLDFTGRAMEAELGDRWTVGIHPDDLDNYLQTYNSAFAYRQPFTIEFRLRRADGQFRWIYDSGTPRISKSGEFLGFIGSCIDVTDRKDAEDALTEAFVQVEEENIYLQEEIRREHDFNEIIGKSDAIKEVFSKIEHGAPTDTTMLILGETGTGKELVARAIHSMSLRKDKPLVKVNCATLPAALIESELFGHEKGAFTGAMARRLGRFELANGGSIFLDEIGDLPPELQAKLLRVLQEGEFERLGSGTTIKVNVRVIAATNRNLPLEVRTGQFREDLWYRLNVFPIVVPPLRTRKEDIPMLVEAFVRKFSKEQGKTIKAISPPAMRVLQDYSWPGNIRELANVIERAVINSEGEILHLDDELNRPQTIQLPFARQTLEDLERQYILQILEETGGRIEGPKGAARILGLNPSTLRTRMVKLGIRKSTDDSQLLFPAGQGGTSS
jgi:PAS domain S-box-containing protein